MLEKFLTWFIEVSPNLKSANDLFNQFIEFLEESGYEIIRANMGTKTLHPQVETISYLWVPHTTESMLETQPDSLSYSRTTHTYKKGLLRENKFNIGSLTSTQFSESPIHYVLKTKKDYYFSFENHIGKEFPFPILEELTKYSPTGYLAVPVVQAGSSFAFLSLLTNKPGGFSLDDQSFLSKALHIISIKWITFLQTDLTESLLNIYLGKSTGSLVQSGKIYRGDLEQINSIIWFSDIRNYSGISEKLIPEDTIELLNAYFGTVIPIIEKNGGEVLKMLGDGILAVFPYTENNKKRVGYKALLAVREAFAELMKLNVVRKKLNKHRILHGVGIHLGEIMYGNIGSKDRLDFTVIGEAVNLTSRIAGMCGELQKAVLASEEFAKEIAVTWEEIGEHKLKGIAKPKKIFGIPEVMQASELKKKMKTINRSEKKERDLESR
jgi:adenylate cyclase